MSEWSRHDPFYGFTSGATTGYAGTDKVGAYNAPDMSFTSVTPYISKSGKTILFMHKFVLANLLLCNLDGSYYDQKDTRAEMDRIFPELAPWNDGRITEIQDRMISEGLLPNRNILLPGIGPGRYDKKHYTIILQELANPWISDLVIQAKLKDSSITVESISYFRRVYTWLSPVQWSKRAMEIICQLYAREVHLMPKSYPHCGTQKLTNIISHTYNSCAYLPWTVVPFAVFKGIQQNRLVLLEKSKSERMTRLQSWVEREGIKIAIILIRVTDYRMMEQVEWPLSGNFSSAALFKSKDEDQKPSLRDEPQSSSKRRQPPSAIDEEPSSSKCS